MNDQGQHSVKRARGEGGLIKVKGSNNWYILWRDASGRQHKESSGSDVKQVALGFLRKRLGDKDAGKTPVTAQKKLRYEDIRALLLDRLEQNGARSLQTVGGKRTLWNLAAVDDFFKGMRVTGINDDAISRYRRQRRAAGANPSTINREMSLLRRMMFTAQRRKKFSGDIPDFQMTSEGASVRRGFLEHKDFERLLTALPKHLHTLMIFLYTVAVRLGEAQALQWSQVDLHHRTMQLWDTKTGEPRTVPLVPELIKKLSAVQTEQRHGAVFYQGQFRKTWAAACIKCGLGSWEIAEGGKKRYRGLIVHDFRRSAIRNMTLAGVPQNVIMSISGHKTISVFLRYNIVAPKQLHTAMEAVELMKRNDTDDAITMQVGASTDEVKKLSD
jgi:integrase